MSTRLLRNTLYGSLAGCAATLSSFFCGLVIARLLGAQKMGDVVFLTWVANTASVVATFGVPFTMSKFLLETEVRRDAKSAISLAAHIIPRFTIAASIPLALAMILASDSLGLQSRIEKTFQSLVTPMALALVGTLCVLLSLGEFARALSRGIQRFDQLAKVTIFSAIVQAFAAIILVRDYGINGALLSYAAGAAALLILLKPLIGARPEAETDGRQAFRRYAMYRWGSEMLALFVWCRIEIIFLQYYCGASSVALFTVALTLGNLAIQGPLMLTWGLMPHFVERFALADHEGMQRAFATATRLLSLLIFPACFGTAAIAHALLPMLFGPTFAPADHVAEVLIASAAFPSIASVGSSVLLASNRNDVDFYACLGGSIVSLLLGVLLTKTFGLMGAAFSRSIVQFGVALCSTLFVCVHLKLHLPKATLVKLIFCASCCAFVAGAITRNFPGVIPLVMSVVAGVLTYVVCLWLCSALEGDDIELSKRLARSLIRPFSRTIATTRVLG